MFAPLIQQQLIPPANEKCFAYWWHHAGKRVAKEHQKEVNTLVILGAWII
jgi:hypothetical protein